MNAPGLSSLKRARRRAHSHRKNILAVGIREYTSNTVFTKSKFPSLRNLYVLSRPFLIKEVRGKEVDENLALAILGHQLIRYDLRAQKITCYIDSIPIRKKGEKIQCLLRLSRILSDKFLTRMLRDFRELLRLLEKKKKTIKTFPLSTIFTQLCTQCTPLIHCLLAKTSAAQ